MEPYKRIYGTVPQFKLNVLYVYEINAKIPI